MRPLLGPQGPQPWTQSVLCNAWATPWPGSVIDTFFTRPRPRDNAPEWP